MMSSANARHSRASAADRCPTAEHAVSARPRPRGRRRSPGSGKRRSISCVIPCFNEGANLRHLLPRLEDILWATGLRWEIIVVDDGSTDDTAAVAQAWCELPGFRCISLSRNFGKEAALTAGLAAATGDAVVLLDGDLQHAPELIHTMVAQWVAGAEVVYAVREARTTKAASSRLGSKLFYRLLEPPTASPCPRTRATSA
jgi:glycosyltransferase involved in cell wall biosynthesis